MHRRVRPRPASRLGPRPPATAARVFPFSATVNAKTNNLAWGAALAGCWVSTFKQLSLAWSLYPNYEFGYLVPWIALLLVFRRVQAAPGCLDPVSQTAPRRAMRLTLAAGVVAAWCFFLFAELLREFDPHWRMVGCMMIGSTTLLTAIYLWQRGGAGLLRRFAFPAAFAWTAVAWPSNIEEAIMLKLRGLVTNVTVAAMHALGAQASHHGNVIDLANGSVVVDSACSGISSFQASIMASLFLGEFFGFRAARRLFLLVAGASLAVAANLLRAILLVRLANDHGADALLAYHNRIGYGETGGIFLALVLLAWCMSLARSGENLEQAAPSGVSHSEPLEAASGFWIGKEGCAVLAAYALLPFVAWSWFALSPGGPIRRQNAPLWTLKAKPAAADWRIEPMELSPLDLDTLDFTEGQTLSLEGPASAQVYHFFWKTDASTGYGHTPDNCMVAAGWQKQGEPTILTLRIAKADFPCKLYRFERNGEKMVVFQSVWYGGEPMLSGNEFPWTKGGPRASRLAMLWERAPASGPGIAERLYSLHGNTGNPDPPSRANPGAGSGSEPLLTSSCYHFFFSGGD